MNYILTLFFIILNLSASGQNPKKFFIIKELEDHSISLAIERNFYTYDDSSKRFESVILVFNKTKDTVEVYNCDDRNCNLDSFGLKIVDFNKIHGFVLTLKITENSNYGEAGAYLIRKTVNEIWSIEFQKRFFSALNDYYYFGDFNSYYPPGVLNSNNPQDTIESIDNWASHHSETEYSYHYNLKINQKSEIEISGITTKLKISEDSYLTGFSTGDTKYPHYCECLKPDNEMGIYKYDNGKFINKNDK
jgi:hypothetical protein